MTAASSGRSAAIIAVLVYALFWGGSTAYLFAAGGEGWFTAVLVMAIFGLALSGVAWLLTRGAVAPPVEVKRPALESGAVLVYLVLYAILFTGYGMTAARAALPEGQQQELLVMALKLTAHIVLPAILLALLGAKLAPLFQAGLSGRKFWRTFIVMSAIILALLCVISPSLRDIAAANPTLATLAWAAPASFLWVTIEAGLCEEFLFRGVLQTRLTAWFRSAWPAVFLTSLVFALAHTPGLFFRGGPGVEGWSTDPWQVVAYTIAVLSPIGLLFGLIYARTKSLLLVVLLHGMVDVLPNLPEFLHIWT